MPSARVIRISICLLLAGIATVSCQAGIGVAKTAERGTTNPDTLRRASADSRSDEELSYSELRAKYAPRYLPPADVRELRTLVVNTSTVPAMKRDTPGLDLHDIQESDEEESSSMAEEEAADEAAPAESAHLRVEEEHPAIDRGILMKEIITILSTKYKWGGMDAVRGLDCSAFTSTVYSRFAGLWIPRTSTTQYYFDDAMPVKKGQLKVGDLVFFKTRPNFGSPVSHVGIYVGAQCFAHASSKRGVIISPLTGYYARTFVGARRVLKDAP